MDHENPNLDYQAKAHCEVYTSSSQASGGRTWFDLEFYQPKHQVRRVFYVQPYPQTQPWSRKKG